MRGFAVIAVAVIATIAMAQLLPETAKPVTPGSAFSGQNVSIFIYYDERYPSNWVNPRAALIYLKGVLESLNIPYQVLNADELRDFMTRGTGIVIFTSDVAPNTVWDGSDGSLILRWIKNGGIVVWVGDWELYYIGYANGSMVHLDGIENKLLGRQVTVAVDGVVVRPTESGARYIPSFRWFKSMRPFDESRLAGLEYEAYGVAELNGRRLLDPCAIRVGKGLFVKVSATAHDNPGFLYALELVLNRFFAMNVKLTADPSSIFHPHVGIVYILPSEVSSPYWQRNFGDRSYFYTKSDLEAYREAIRNDFRKISSEYNFVILVVPLSDSQLFKANARLIDEVASQEGLGVLYAVFPKWDYGPEYDYLKPGSRVNTVFVSVARFLTNLSSTIGVAVWYGWKGRNMDPEELERFYLSLTPDLRQRIWLWLDQPFVEEAYRSGIIKKADELNMTVVTELYSPSMLAAYQNVARRQMIVTGYWNASSVEEWVDGMRRKLELVRTPGRILGVWIFWDVNDGSGEAYRAYIEGKLANPLRGGSERPTATVTKTVTETKLTTTTVTRTVTETKTASKEVPTTITSVREVTVTSPSVVTVTERQVVREVDIALTIAVAVAALVAGLLAGVLANRRRATGQAPP